MGVETHNSSNPIPFSFSFSELRQFERSPSRSEVKAPSLEFDSLASDGSVNRCDLVDSSAAAAVKVQKVYRSYRTRRRFADTAVVAEVFWCQAIDYARLNHSTISFFNFPETAAARWNRVSLNASRVGKGLSQDPKALKLGFQHWIEAIDPRHRYGHNLNIYFDVWCKANSGQPFFNWLDIGDGKTVDLEQCPRKKLRQQCIKYLGPQERKLYEYILVEGKIINKHSRDPLDTKSVSEGTKWIFVMSTCKKLYAGVKEKGRFHHSSFLAGGATLAAGRLVVEDGILKSISAYSGHYRPTEDRLDSFLSFLKENGVNLDEVEIQKSNEDYFNDESKSGSSVTGAEIPLDSETSQHDKALEAEKNGTQESTFPGEADLRNEYKRTLSGGLQTPRTEVPKEAILQRINSKKYDSYELGHQLSRSWSTGVGPRIGCIADYPSELRFQAMEFTELSPRRPSPLTICNVGSVAAPPLLSPSS